MNHVYQNKYGRLEIEVIGSYQDVTKMYSKDFAPNSFFTIDEAEKITLITGNDGIQIAFSKHEGSYRAALLRHESSNSAALCRIVSLDFVKDVDAREVLARPKTIGPIY